jgi:hypothetical protein
MRSRVVARVATVLLVVAGCGVGPGSEVGARGDLVVDRVAAGRSLRFLDEPAVATYCSNDSLLTIVAVGRNGAAGFAVRTTLPLSAPKTFQVAPALADTSSAEAVIRVRTGVARVGVSGRIRLEGSATISGEFDVALPDSAGARPRLTGRLSRIPVRTGTRAGCGAV